MVMMQDNRTLTSTLKFKLSRKRTTVLGGNTFEFGFFKADGDRWYLGVWYRRFSDLVVWVANRDNPLSTSIGTLEISSANLVLRDQSGNLVWSTNLKNQSSPPLLCVLEFLDNGNLVLRYHKDTSPSSFLWQSFDYPTDTLLPGMKLGWDRRTNLERVLRSWKSEHDPSTGEFYYKIEKRQIPEGFIYKGDSDPVYRTGLWDGVALSGISTTEKSKYVDFNITVTREEVTFSFHITNSSFYSFLRMEYGGNLQRWTLVPTARVWKMFMELPSGDCDDYNKCGRNSYCDEANRMSRCNCIEGFKPREQHAWDLKDFKSGCIQKTQVSCGVQKKEKEVGFLPLKKMKVPDTKTAAIVDTRKILIGLEECKKRCLQNCNCTAVASTDMRNGFKSGCAMWTGDLVDMRKYPIHGQDLYVKLVASDIPHIGGEDRAGMNNKIIIGLCTGFFLVTFLIICIFFFIRRKRMRARGEANNNVIRRERHQNFPTGSTHVDFETIVSATNGFSNHNEIGKGGYGIVYKGTLPNGQEIAVKRLTKKTSQGIQGLKNEVNLIARVQHVNLVRLLGSCFTNTENILVYEYLHNSSLDSYLFGDETRRSILNWEMRSNIANGIARGLLYLHQDSRFRIIHLDLKPSNILLDKNMVPKISDFGMAKMVGEFQTQVNATSVVGTYGYISPEYVKNSVYSVKSDLYSFGILLLEMVCGQRNIDFIKLNDGYSLPRHIWSNWNQGKGLDIVDPVLKADSSTFRDDQVVRYLQIGLLCAQELAEDRPTISSVSLMLSSNESTIPRPKQPLEVGSSSVPNFNNESSSGPQITMSTFGAR